MIALASTIMPRQGNFFYQRRRTITLTIIMILAGLTSSCDRKVETQRQVQQATRTVEALREHLQRYERTVQESMNAERVSLDEINGKIRLLQTRGDAEALETTRELGRQKEALLKRVSLIMGQSKKEETRMELEIGSLEYELRNASERAGK